jgi:hypothetical protein
MLATRIAATDTRVTISPLAEFISVGPRLLAGTAAGGALVASPARRGHRVLDTTRRTDKLVTG